MRETEYAYAVAYIKTIENKMLTRSDIEALLTSDLVGCERLLRDRGWQGDSLNAMLENELKRAYKAAEDVLDDSSPVDILFYANDFHNLKTVLKAIFSGVNWEGMVLSPSVVEPTAIAESIKSGDYSLLPDFIRDTARGAYEIVSRTNDGQMAEIYIDNAFKAAILARTKAENDEFLTGWAELVLKLIRFKTLWRCVKMGKSAEFMLNAAGDIADSVEEVKTAISKEFPDADTKTLADFEGWCDSKELSYVKIGRAESFSFRPIMAFLIGKKYEVQAVRIILSGKRGGISTQQLRERVGWLAYV